MCASLSDELEKNSTVSSCQVASEIDIYSYTSAKGSDKHWYERKIAIFI